MTTYTPVLVAEADILPFRFVQVGATDNGALAGALNAVDIVGVSEGDNIEFDSVNHAIAGTNVRLQTGPVVKVEAGEAFAVGARVGCLTAPSPGQAGTTAVTVFHGIALQAAAAVNEIVEIYLTDPIGALP